MCFGRQRMAALYTLLIAQWPSNIFMRSQSHCLPQRKAFSRPSSYKSGGWVTADQSSRSLHKKRSDVACVCCGEREGVGSWGGHHRPWRHLLMIIYVWFMHHATCVLFTHSHHTCTCNAHVWQYWLLGSMHTHTHTKKRCVYHLMPGSILAAGPVSVLESLEVSAVSCQRASAVWRIKSPACLYFSRPLLPWKQVPRISHFFIFLYTIHITPPPPPPPFMLQLPCCFLPPQPAA